MIYDYSLNFKEEYCFATEGIWNLDGGMVDMRWYQAQQACTYAKEGRCLNVGCNWDPSKIHEVVKEIVNLDVRDYDPEISEDRRDLTKVPGFVKGDLRDMGYKSEFDCVVMGELLEHMTWKCIFQHFEAVWEALKDDGALIITCPEEHPCRLTAEFGDRESLGQECSRGSYPSHVNWITEHQLREALEWMGFYVIEFRVVRVYHSLKFLEGLGNTHSQKFINQNNQFLVTALRNNYPKWREK
ncbi:hypothetical protein IID24_02785 [Patescibacteria group bacterium]|nr:hypothetical protein [Patescibacteria group bacterium]